MEVRSIPNLTLDEAPECAESSAHQNTHSLQSSDGNLKKNPDAKLLKPFLLILLLACIRNFSYFLNVLASQKLFENEKNVILGFHSSPIG